jgi:hypothetical protein
MFEKTETLEFPKEVDFLPKVKTKSIGQEKKFLMHVRTLEKIYF